jgi:hypothetical protein
MTVGIGDVTYCAALVVEPAEYTTTDAFADVPGSTLDALNYRCVSYTLKENNTNAIEYQVIASNDAAFTVPVEAQASADIGKNGTGSYSATVAPYRYYKIQARANVGSSQGKVTVVGYAKS